MKIIVLDVETTGLDPADHAVIEIAARELTGPVGGWEPGFCKSAFVAPGRPIGFEAMGVHHIIEADLECALSLDEVVSAWFPPGSLTHVAFVAHNATFDRSFLPMLANEVAWIDTYRCAKHLWPDAPSYGNCALYYWLGFERPKLVKPHSAEFDTLVTAGLSP